MSDSVQPHGHQLTRVLCPRDSPGKNTGVGCHFPSPYQIESGRYLTLGRSCGKFPSSFSVPRGKALLGTTAHHGISASSLSGSVPGIWEAKPRQPLPLLQEILVQGVWRADTRPRPRGEPRGALRQEGGRTPVWGRPGPSEPAAAAAGLPPWPPSLPRPLPGPRLAGTAASASPCWGPLETPFPSLFYTQCPRNNILLICN